MSISQVDGWISKVRKEELQDNINNNGKKYSYKVSGFSSNSMRVRWDMQLKIQTNRIKKCVYTKNKYLGEMNKKCRS